MERQALISVIIPVYNTRVYLPECISSVLGQTYRRLDVILVDDGSSDGSGILCDSYADRDNRVRVIHQSNGGLMSAWMAGVREASGEYLLFVDSDDWIEPVMVEELAAQLLGVPGEVVCSNYLIEKGADVKAFDVKASGEKNVDNPNSAQRIPALQKKRKSIPVLQSIEPGVYGREEIIHQLFPRLLGQENRAIHSSRCMKLLQKDLILNNMDFCNPKVTMGEDINLILPVLLEAERIVIMEKGLYYHYRFVDNSMVHKYQPQLAQNLHLLYQTLKKLLEEKPLATGQEWRKRLLYDLKKEYIFLLFLALKNELRGPKSGCTSRIQRIIREAKTNEGLEEIKVQAESRANQLLYFIWKKPGMYRIFLGRLAMRVFEWLA